MADFLTPQQRSIRMARIPGKDTSPEVALRKALHASGLRFRLHVKLPGKPDIVLPKFKTAIFVHGCFWHRHNGCPIASNPKSNVEFWQEKFIRNVSRDARVEGELNALGWHVILVWECELSGKGKATLVATEIARSLRIREGAAGGRG